MPSDRCQSEKPPLRVTVSIGGPFPAPLRLAAYLEREGLLERMISFMPLYRIRWAEISDVRLVRLWPLGYLSYVARHTPIVKGWAGYTWHIAEWFDRLASRRLGACTLFNGWCMTALHSMRRAKARGMATVLQMGSMHMATQTQLLQAEYAKFGQQQVATDPRLVEKAEREYAEADHIVVPSRLVKRTLVEKGIDPSRISIVHEAVTRRLQGPRKSDDVFRVICVGRVELRKGVQYLLEAFSRLKLPNAELLLVGGAQNEAKSLLARHAGLYRATGYLSGEDLGRAYSQSSVLVLPSIEDGWGHVTLEAMSCGLPVIVSANAGSADMVENGITGFVVPACDAHALTEKIEFLYRHPDVREQMGRQGQLRVKDRTWATYGGEMLDVFNAVDSGMARRPTDNG